MESASSSSKDSANASEPLELKEKKSSMSIRSSTRRSTRNSITSSTRRLTKSSIGRYMSTNDVKIGKSTNIKLRCTLCLQTETEKVEIPNNAEVECVVLTDKRLANIYTDNSDAVQHNLTNFIIYDENGHICSLDSGILERNVVLYLTGYVKPIFDQSSSIDDGIPVFDLGPILEWWLSPYDGGSQPFIGISTNFADYLLIKPHFLYKKFNTSIIEKMYLSKLVIESILDYQESDDPTYEDILCNVINSVNPAKENNKNFTEEDLITHAQFVLNQVTDYDANSTCCLPLADTKCIETLIQLSGAAKNKPQKKSLDSDKKSKSIKINKPQQLSKASTTYLVKDVFESFFSAQLDNGNKENKNATSKPAVNGVFVSVSSETNEKVFFNTNIDDRYQSLRKDLKVSNKMFVFVKDNTSEAPPLIGRVEYIYSPKAHLTLFIRGCDTVLGEASNPHEIFALNKCIDVETSYFDKILNVVKKTPGDDWFTLGNSKNISELDDEIVSDTSFFYQFKYDEEFGRFESINVENVCHDNKNKYCYNCEMVKLKKESQVPKLLEPIEQTNGFFYFYKFKLRNEEYKVGSFIYLQPGIFSTSSRFNFLEHKLINPKKSKNTNNHVLKTVDEVKYPEYYRKSIENYIRGSNESTPDPFEIAEILSISILDGESENIKIIVRRLYRAEHVLLDKDVKNASMNKLYWSKEEFTVSYKDICGKCYVASSSNLQDPLTWSIGGPDRFYFSEQWDFLSNSIVPEHLLPSTAKLTGHEVYVNYNYKFVDKDKLQYIPSYKQIKPLNGLDIFAGCGGLSRGLEDSGLVKTKWAIESDDNAARAFKLNNPESCVFVEDCNQLLNLAMSGNKTNNKNQQIPQKGEVDFICGGPPCQGFSGMNRFNSGEYSLFTNSLIVSFLSYIDFYRPKFFVMENVRNFVSFKKSMVLKLTLKCITRMGYQCTFGILQAGNFGVPQTRRRLIIMAAAPGEKLPFFPEPVHVFNRKGSGLSVQVGDKKFKTNCRYDEYAPMRTVTVYDAWSDLPKISNGAFEEEIIYNSPPITHLQKLLRYPNNWSTESILKDHICKNMSALVQARIQLIPVNEGSDWRDLPNIQIQLLDGTITDKLNYAYHDMQNGNGPDNALRGVCQCVNGEECNPSDRQRNTIIPWCLPHTANRHNSWPGLYGRISWNGYCSTTITNPEPMGKQGRVLHPDQHRVVSVRECARSQGFKDSFIFYGPIINKHRQIGNAVPPPMGKAIGHEIIKVIASNK